MMILEEGHHRDNPDGRHQDLKLVSSRQLNLLDVLGHTLSHVLAEVGQVLSDHRVELPDGWSGLQGSLGALLSESRPGRTCQTSPEAGHQPR